MQVVMKFGGSSVETIEAMGHVASKVIQKQKEGFAVVVVLSAMGKTTNQLLSLAKTAAKYPSKREIDLLISTGEQVSIALFTMILNEKGIDAVSLTGAQAGIKTQGLHTKNKIDDIDIQVIKNHLELGKIVVVAGFQGVNQYGDITTLGRGGSDTTAVAIASMLKCTAEIYTDVAGVYSVDPRIYKAAKKLDYITYEEMKEMAFQGAKVMEPRSIEIGHKYKTPIYVAHSKMDVIGTYITEEQMIEDRYITGISVSEKVVMITLKKFPFEAMSVAKLFVALAEAEVNVDMINQTPTSDRYITISFTASADDVDAVNKVITDTTKDDKEIEIIMDDEIVKISVIGTGMREQSGVAAELFKILAENGIIFKLVTTSEISISYTIDKKLKETAVSVIAKKFNL